MADDRRKEYEEEYKARLKNLQYYLKEAEIDGKAEDISYYKELINETEKNLSKLNREPDDADSIIDKSKKAREALEKATIGLASGGDPVPIVGGKRPAEDILSRVVTPPIKTPRDKAGTKTSSVKPPGTSASHVSESPAKISKSGSKPPLTIPPAKSSEWDIPADPKPVVASTRPATSLGTPPAPIPTTPPSPLPKTPPVGRGRRSRTTPTSSVVIPPTPSVPPASPPPPIPPRRVGTPPIPPIPPARRGGVPPIPTTPPPVRGTPPTPGPAIPFTVTPDDDEPILTVVEPDEKRVAHREILEKLESGREWHSAVKREVKSRENTHKEAKKEVKIVYRERILADRKLHAVKALQAKQQKAINRRKESVAHYEELANQKKEELLAARKEQKISTSETKKADQEVVIKEKERDTLREESHEKIIKAGEKVHGAIKSQKQAVLKHHRAEIASTTAKRKHREAIEFAGKYTPAYTKEFQDKVDTAKSKLELLEKSGHLSSPKDIETARSSLAKAEERLDKVKKKQEIAPERVSQAKKRVEVSEGTLSLAKEELDKASSNVSIARSAYPLAQKDFQDAQKKIKELETQVSESKKRAAEAKEKEKLVGGKVALAESSETASRKDVETAKGKLGDARKTGKKIAKKVEEKTKKKHDVTEVLKDRRESEKDTAEMLESSREKERDERSRVRELEKAEKVLGKEARTEEEAETRETERREFESVISKDRKRRFWTGGGASSLMGLFGFGSDEEFYGSRGRGRGRSRAGGPARGPGSGGRDGSGGGRGGPPGGGRGGMSEDDEFAWLKHKSKTDPDAKEDLLAKRLKAAREGFKHLGRGAYEEHAEGMMGEWFKAGSKFSKAIPGMDFAEPVMKFGSVLMDSVGKLRNWTDHLHESNMQFANFSASMAAVQARQERRDILLEQKRGERLAPAAERLAEARHEFRERSSEVVDKFKIFLMDGIAVPVLGALNKILEKMGLGDKDDVDTWDFGKAIEDNLASFGFDTEDYGRPPRFPPTPRGR